MSRSRILCSLFVWLVPLTLLGQNPSVPPHQAQMQHFGRPGLQTERDYDREYRIVARGKRNSAQKCVLKQQVYGFHPYWRGTAYEHYDFGLLSTVAYYGCEVNPATGLPADLHQWRESNIVELAHARGSRVDLVATLYGGAGLRQLLGDTLRQQVLADTLVALVKEKDADGICLDFQGVDEKMALSFGRFVRRMIISLRTADPIYELSLVLPARDPEKGYDAGVLATYVDRFIVAAYDYRGVDAATAGPVAPLEDGPGADGSVGNSVMHYLKQGAPKEKILLGLPYYGYQWPTESPQPGAKIKGKGEIVLFSQFMEQYRNFPTQWDSLSESPYRSWIEGDVPQQVWVDDFRSLIRKVQYVKKMDLAGIGIWALGYDHGQDVLWEMVRDRCADCDAVNTQQFNERSKVLDGPTSAERNKDNWIWILAGTIGLIVILFFVRRMK